MTVVKVDFEFETKYGKFADAIWYSGETPPSEEELESEKQRRLANWLAVIENPAPVEPGSPQPEPEVPLSEPEV